MGIFKQSCINGHKIAGCCCKRCGVSFHSFGPEYTDTEHETTAEWYGGHFVDVDWTHDITCRKCDKCGYVEIVDRHTIGGMC